MLRWSSNDLGVLSTCVRMASRLIGKKFEMRDLFILLSTIINAECELACFKLSLDSK